MSRIAILGNTAGGKSTLARRLSKTRNLPHIEIDELFWLPDWSTVSHEDYERNHDAAIGQESWIIDGGGDLPSVTKRAERADAVVAWIDEAGLKADQPILTKSQRGGAKTPMDPATLSRIIWRCTSRKDVSAHSTRVGGVQDAFRLGCDLSSIMVAGRWNSPEMPAQYARRLLASQSAAAKVSEAFQEGLV